MLGFNSKYLSFRIGPNVEIRYDKPCNRCPIITINPLTGEKHPRMEPLRTLRSYRLVNPKDCAQNAKIRKTIGESPYFMVNFGLVTAGNVSIGDDVLVEVLD